MAGSFDPSFCKSLTLRCFTDVNTWLPIIYHESAWLHDNSTVHHFAKRNLGPPMQMRHARGFSGKWLLKDDSHPSLAANVFDLIFGKWKNFKTPMIRRGDVLSPSITCYSRHIPSFESMTELGRFHFWIFYCAIGLIVEWSPLIPSGIDHVRRSTLSNNYGWSRLWPPVIKVAQHENWPTE